MFILLAGLVNAALIYLMATDDIGDAVGYDISSGTVYAIAPGDSKMYRHDLELYGGKAAVFADELDRWFAHLWQGRRLAFTLAVIYIGLALVCFIAARHVSNRPPNEP